MAKLTVRDLTGCGGFKAITPAVERSPERGSCPVAARQYKIPGRCIHLPELLLGGTAIGPGLIVTVQSMMVVDDIQRWAVKGINCHRTISCPNAFVVQAFSYALMVRPGRIHFVVVNGGFTTK